MIDGSKKFYLSKKYQHSEKININGNEKENVSFHWWKFCCDEYWKYLLQWTEVFLITLSVMSFLNGSIFLDFHWLFKLGPTKTICKTFFVPVCLEGFAKFSEL